MLDGQDISPVGGRLHNANVAEREKHHIIIPGQSSYAKILIEDAHERTLYHGVQLITSVLQREYRLTQGRIHIHSETLRCITCRRQGGRNTP